MLKKGKFIKEAPLEIGKFWQPLANMPYRSPEERLIFRLVMGYKMQQPPLATRLLGQLLKL